MNIKNKCVICNSNTLGILAKIPLFFNLSMKCKHCGARYITQKINIKEPWHFIFKYLVKFFNFLISLIWLPLFIAFVYVFITELNVGLMLSLGLILVTMIFINFRPYRLDEQDSMNGRIKRIEEVKQKNKNSA